MDRAENKAYYVGGINGLKAKMAGWVGVVKEEVEIRVEEIRN